MRPAVNLAVFGSAILGMLSLPSAGSWAEAARPRELGDVAWIRDHDAARAESKASGRPLLILFDEVPGCERCVSYGETVLSDEALVQAIEAAFVPLAIYNNRGGADRATLEAYGEPAWNNPVVRIVDADGRALAPRHAGDYTVRGLARRMATALERAGRPQPTALRRLLDVEKD